MLETNGEHFTVAERLNREEQNMLAEVAEMRRANYGRAEMVVARRLARKGLVTIKRVKFADGSALTWVTAVPK